jgi:hypothetical protein
MAKEWKTISTVNDMEKTEFKGNKTFDKLMSKTPKRNLDQLKEHNDKAFEKQKTEEGKLLDAFANKKLKSKAAIKRARGLAKRKRDAGKSTDKTVNPQDNIVTEG